jgi:hypothetical protein
MYMAVWDAIGASSGENNPEKLSKIVLDLCFKIAEEKEGKNE